MPIVDPDVEACRDDIDVSGRLPVGSRVLPVRIAERDVNARELLVLQDVADHFLEFDIGADRKFANAIRIRIGVRVLPEVGFELFVLAVGLDEAVVPDPEGQRKTLESFNSRA